MSEVAIYASFLKDVIYSCTMLFVFFVVAYPQYIVFTAHVLSWLAVFLYFVSNENQFLIPTFGIFIAMAVVAVDAWIALTTTCFLFSKVCCLRGEKTAPFSYGYQVCQVENLFLSDPLVYTAVATISLGILNGMSLVNLYSANRASSSIETACALMYGGLRIWLLTWHSLSYSALFYFQTILNVSINVTAVLLSYYFKFVGALLLIGALGLDLLMTLSQQHLFDALENSARAVSGRHLLAITQPEPQVIEALSGSARQALRNAVTVLATFNASAGPDEGSQVILRAADLLKSLELGVREQCGERLACASIEAEVRANQYILANAPCCERNTRYDLVIKNLAQTLGNFDLNFDSSWSAQSGTVSTRNSQLPGVPSNVNVNWAWSQFVKQIRQFKVLKIARQFWSMITRNGRNTAEPWLSVNGERLPDFISWVWLAVVYAGMLLLVFEIVNVFLRRPDTAKPFFGAKFKRKHEDADSAKKTDAQTIPSDGYGAHQLRQRRSAKDDEYDVKI